MKLVLIAALVAACGAAKLDRSYLPPASAHSAGGSPGSLQTPFVGNSFNQGLGGLPKGSFTNDFQGVVVDAAAAGTRASEGETGLGAPRISYGSTNSKVGDAAFAGFAGFRQGNHQVGNVDTDMQAASHQASGEGFNHASSEAHIEAKPERAQASYDRVANTLRYENEVNPESYNFAFETDNGISAEENGIDANGVKAQGGYSYTGDDGQVYSITYTADEGGYQPRGDHLPTPPPIPEEILKSLEQNARDEAAGVIDDGSYDAEKYNAGADYAETDVTHVEQNDRQAPTFGKRPVSDASASGTFINQSNQPFVRPSPNEEQGQATFGSQDIANNAFQASAFSQAQSTRVQNRFGSQNENYSPGSNNNKNVRPQNPLENLQFNAGFTQKISSTTASEESQPSSTFGRPTTNKFDVNVNSDVKPSSINYDYEQSSNTAFDAAGGQLAQNFGSFGNRNQFSSPVRNENGKPQKPIAVSQGFNQNSQAFASFQTTSQSNIQTPFSQAPQATNALPKKQQTVDEVVQNKRPASFNTQRPTAQPSLELTTPLESSEQSKKDVNDFSDHATAVSANSQSSDVQLSSRFGSQSKQPVSRPQFPTTQSQSFAQQSQTQYQPEEKDNLPSVRPTYNHQQQGPDSSYYYRQPAKPFNTPIHPESRFPSSSSGQFNRVTQHAQSSAQFSGPTQQEFAMQSFQSQRQPNRGSTRYPQPPTLAPNAPTAPSNGQFQESTFISQHNGNVQSSNVFQPQYQGSTKYPKPPTVAPTAPTTPLGGPQQFNKITQATATAFASSAPSFADNFNTQSFEARPTFQSQTNFQSMAFATSQGQESQTDKDDSPSVPTQQYSGEVYEYNKPPETLPAPAKPEPVQTAQARPKPQFSQFESTRVEQKQQQPRPFATRPSFEAQPMRPQFNSPTVQDQPAQGSMSQFNFQPKPFNAQSQVSRPQNGVKPNCCQTLNSKITQLESHQNRRIPVGPSFGAQFSGSAAQSHAFVGEKEVFGGPRNPPSFDSETGYHY